MAFETEPTRIATGIGDITVTLYQPDPDSDEAAGASYNVRVQFSDGSVVVRSGNLVPHLTQTQINQLLSFMAMLRQKAIAEFLPG